MKNGPREDILYVLCVQPDPAKHDYLAIIDVDPISPSYCQVVFENIYFDFLLSNLYCKRYLLTICNEQKKFYSYFQQLFNLSYLIY